MNVPNSTEFGRDIIKKTISAILEKSSSVDELEAQANTTVAAMMELAPQDAIEGMLISQMVAIYGHAMECLRLATSDSIKSSREAFQTLYNQSAKLMRTYILQMEALKKHRTGGKQKMTVEHVHVHKGGQAIVGSINRGGGGKDKK